MTLHTTFPVGRLRCHTLEGGVQRLDGGAMFGVVPKPLWSKRIPPDERNRIPLAMRCLLVEHPDGLVLIDTGARQQGERQVPRHLRHREPGARGRHAARGRARRRRVPRRRRALGDQHPPALRPRRRQHHDRSGAARTIRGVTCGRPSPTRRYVVQQGELEFARHTNERTRASYLPHNFEPVAAAQPLAAARGRRRDPAGDLGAARPRATCRTTRSCWSATAARRRPSWPT